MHAKYEVSISFSISYGSEVKAKVKVDNRQTYKQTGQKQYAFDHSIRGHKKLMSMMKNVQCYYQCNIHSEMVKVKVTRSLTFKNPYIFEKHNSRHTLVDLSIFFLDG